MSTLFRICRKDGDNTTTQTKLIKDTCNSITVEYPEDIADRIDMQVGLIYLFKKEEELFKHVVSNVLRESPKKEAMEYLKSESDILQKMEAFGK